MPIGHRGLQDNADDLAFVTVTWLPDCVYANGSTLGQWADSGSTNQQWTTVAAS